MRELNEDRTWLALPWRDERLIDIKAKLHLDSLPRVIVLDKNLEVVSWNAQDDLLMLRPSACRSYWIELLTQKLTEKNEENLK